MAILSSPATYLGAWAEPLRPFLDVDRRPDPLAIGLMLLGAIGGGVGLAYVFYNLFLYGHAAFNTSSDVAWGAPIAFYLFFLLSSSGLSILASVDSVFGVNVFYPIAKRCVWLSIITLIAGFSILALEIGHPFRMLWALPFSFQIHSPMWWMGILYSLDLLLLIVKFWLLHMGRWHSRTTHLVSVASFVVCILAPGTLGLVFGMMAMRPAWYSPVMPMYFILTGFMSAMAFITFFTAFEPKATTPDNVRHLHEATLPRLFFLALLAVAGMRFGQILTSLWSNFEGMEANWHVMGSSMFKSELLFGLILPILLLSTNGLRRSAVVRFVAASLAMVGIFLARLNLLIVGQVVPLFKGYWAGFVDYWPSMTEWMLIPAGFGIFCFIYGAGHWLLRLEAQPEPSATA
jgi:molybdopterin-containing oxidoreductase family membrane subunit